MAIKQYLAQAPSPQSQPNIGGVPWIGDVSVLELGVLAALLVAAVGALWRERRSSQDDTRGNFNTLLAQMIEQNQRLSDTVSRGQSSLIDAQKDFYETVGRIQTETADAIDKVSMAIVANERTVEGYGERQGDLIRSYERHADQFREMCRLIETSIRITEDAHSEFRVIHGEISTTVDSIRAEFARMVVATEDNPKITIGELIGRTFGHKGRYS